VLPNQQVNTFSSYKQQNLTSESFLNEIINVNNYKYRSLKKLNITRATLRYNHSRCCYFSAVFELKVKLNP